MKGNVNGGEESGGNFTRGEEKNSGEKRYNRDNLNHKRQFNTHRRAVNSIRTNISVQCNLAVILHNNKVFIIFYKLLTSFNIESCHIEVQDYDIEVQKRFV